MKRPLNLFLLLTFVTSWLIWAFLWLSGWYQNQVVSLIMTGIAMWSPALAAIITQKQYKMSWVYSFRLGLKNHLKTYAMMWFGLPLLIILGMVLYFLVFSGDFDTTLSSLRQLAGEGANLPPIQILVLLTLFSLFTSAPVINGFLALGEELGWRGFLYPLLKKEFGQRKADLVTGLIWVCGTCLFCSWDTIMV
ncbi:CPBP family glutamic-type intramembrane protease [Streptococcus merionis]|uniref:CPBP family glutamic-type intramembrane protease n=1 Tax=Streptococcus merionis TaxID=400065 RepID=UPI003514B17A